MVLSSRNEADEPDILHIVSAVLAVLAYANGGHLAVDKAQFLMAAANPGKLFLEYKADKVVVTVTAQPDDRLD